jgi:hypothetical protein
MLTYFRNFTKEFLRAYNPSAGSFARVAGTSLLNFESDPSARRLSAMDFKKMTVSSNCWKDGGIAVMIKVFQEVRVAD